MSSSILNLYIDDSGSRHPDRRGVGNEKNARDWFALGGVLIKDEDEAVARRLIKDFRQRWPILEDFPLHSVDIRTRSKNFRWLYSTDQETKDRFFSDIDQLLVDLPIYGTACVIDRPGYNARYMEKYGKDRWSLCKTAFAILVERSVKHAIRNGRKLRIFVEECNKKVDNKTREYFKTLKAEGAPFDAANSSLYAPLTSKEYAEVLYDFKLKKKSSPLMQVADIFLWPMCMGGYHKSNRPYLHFKDNEKLIDSLYRDEISTMGIKYSCFDNVEIKQ